MNLAVITSLKTQSVVAVTPIYEGTLWKLFQKVMKRISIILQYKEYYTVTSFLSMKELTKRRIFHIHSDINAVSRMKNLL